MKYRYYFSAIQCNKLLSNFIRNADVGIDHFGLSITITYLSDKKLTNEEIEKTIKYIENSEQEKELKAYITNVKLDRVELLKGE